MNTGGGGDGRLLSRGSAANSGHWRAARYAPGAVLRPGLCLRCDPALPPAAGPLEYQRSFGDAIPVTGGVVGLGLHGLVHQLVRPRSAAGSPGAGRRDAREPVNVGRDPGGLRQARVDVRPGIRRHTGRAHRLRGARPVWRVPPTERNLLEDPHLVGGGRRVVGGGGLLEGRARYVLWLLALAVDYAGPVMRYRTPGLGSSRTEDWTIEGRHFAERCQLFVIVALGESILVTGTTFGEVEPSLVTVSAFVVAFLG